MRDLGYLWDDCQRGVIPRTQWHYERRLTVGNSEPYYDERIKDLEFERGLLYNEFNLGQTVSSKLKTSIVPRPNESISFEEELKLEIRINTLYNGSTDWFEFGYYLVTSAEEEFERWTIEALDYMTKLEVDFIGSRQAGLSWPATSKEIVDVIANYMGVDIDPRTKLDSYYQFIELDGITMREALSYVGSANGGNWNLTESNKLRLVVPTNPLSNNPVAIVNNNNSKKLTKGSPILIDKVIMQYGKNDGEAHKVGNGNVELEIMNPWATEGIALDNYDIITKAGYYPYKINSTEINPAIELGDVIEVNGVKTHLWQIQYPLGMYPNIDIPEDKSSKKQYGTLLVSDGGEHGDFDGDRFQERLDIIEELLGMRGCELLNPNNSTFLGLGVQDYMGDNNCVIVPSRYEQFSGAEATPIQVVGNLSNPETGVNKVRKIVMNQDSNLWVNVNNTFSGLHDENAIIDLSEMNIHCGSFSPISNATIGKLILPKFKAGNDLHDTISTSFSKTTIPTLDISPMANVSKVSSVVARVSNSTINNLDLSNLNIQANIYGDIIENSTIDNLIMNNVKLDRSQTYTGYKSLFKGSNIKTLYNNNLTFGEKFSMKEAFKRTSINVHNLQNISIPKISKIENCFNYSDVKGINISNWDISEVNDVSGMFNYYNHSVVGEDINILDGVSGLSKLDVSNVKNFSNFYDLRGGNNFTSYSKNRRDVIENLGLSNWDMSSAEHIDNMLKMKVNNEGNDITVNLSNWGIMNLKSMAYFLRLDRTFSDYYIFDGKERRDFGSVNIDLNGWDTSSVDDFSRAFFHIKPIHTSDGRNKITIDISSFDIKDTANVDNMFPLTWRGWITLPDGSQVLDDYPPSVEVICKSEVVEKLRSSYEASYKPRDWDDNLPNRDWWDETSILFSTN